MPDPVPVQAEGHGPAVKDVPREELTAGSPDGRAFTFDHPGAPLMVGDLVAVRPDEGGRLLGQVLEQPATAAGGAGGGLLIGELRPDGELGPVPRHPFASAAVEEAAQGDLESLQRSRHATLPVGSWRSAQVAVPARLRAQGFARHTFLCGQSGSGKTYALGVILEQLLLGTDLRLVVLDPNADFVGLGQPRTDAPADAAQRLGATDVRVLGADARSGEPLRMRFATMPHQAQASVLQLDPLVDRGEYNHFLHMMADSGPQDVGGVVAQLRQGGPHGEALAQRVENLGMPYWTVWAGELRSAAEVVDGGARATVLDLSGFGTPQEPLAVCLDLVEDLWSRRERRVPTLIVVDEAHNICPAEPAGLLQAALVHRLVQIAAEGRKYGLWLLLSTQRPSKIHQQVLSQCDNLVLMRMNSRADLAELTEVFGFAPPAMVRASGFFAQGEALLAGAFVPLPSLIEIGARITVEGGSDIAVPLS
jgi:uncharacterized protein